MNHTAQHIGEGLHAHGIGAMQHNGWQVAADALQSVTGAIVVAGIIFTLLTIAVEWNRSRSN